MNYQLLRFNADYCFHFSSVGELEQCFPIIHLLLERNKKIELLYTSDSVEGKVNHLTEEFPSRVRSLALPLLSFNLFTRNIDKLISAKHLTLVRYDFFPELLVSAKSRKSVLLSSTLIGKNVGFFRSRYLRYVYSCFNNIVTASYDDKVKLFEYFGIESINAEVRIDQILKRKNNLPHNFQRLGKFDERHILFGSVWPEDINILEKGISRFLDRNGTSIFFAPHNLDQKFIKKIVEKFSSLDVRVIDNHHSLIKSELGKVNILTYKGLLLETYSLFKVAYVGGGFGRSIHSVLEPFLSNCFVLCGPKVGRSTEYKLICEKDPRMVKVIHNSDTFLKVIISLLDNQGIDFQEKKLSNDEIEKVIEHYE